MQTATKKIWNARGKFDPIHSTFKCEFFCVSGRQFPGYSKGIETKEIQDKISLLCKWIGRLSKSEKKYFNPNNIDRIEFYLMGLNNNELIFILYPDTFKMGFNEKYSFNERLIQFLKIFYSDLKKNKLDVEKIIPKPIKLTEDQRFHTRYKYIKDEIELLEHIILGRKDGYEVSFLLGWAQKYREKYF